MSDFNDDQMERLAMEREEDGMLQRAENERAEQDRSERFGPGVCVRGTCVEPCGMDGGCIR